MACCRWDVCTHSMPCALKTVNHCRVCDIGALVQKFRSVKLNLVCSLGLLSFRFGSVWKCRKVAVSRVVGPNWPRLLIAVSWSQQLCREWSFVSEWKPLFIWEAYMPFTDAKNKETCLLALKAKLKIRNCKGIYTLLTVRLNGYIQWMHIDEVWDMKTG